MPDDRILRPVTLDAECAQLAWEVVRQAQAGYAHWHTAARLRATFEDAAKPEAPTPSVEQTEQAFGGELHGDD